jgi:hypothetical protein
MSWTSIEVAAEQMLENHWPLTAGFLIIISVPAG